MRSTNGKQHKVPPLAVSAASPLAPGALSPSHAAGDRGGGSMVFTVVNHGLSDLYWAKYWCFGDLQEMNLCILEGVFAKSWFLSGFLICGMRFGEFLV